MRGAGEKRQSLERLLPSPPPVVFLFVAPPAAGPRVVCSLEW
jgi:hypothetical protein